MEEGSRYFAFVAAAWGASALVLLALTVDSVRRARRWRVRAERRQGEDGS
jgi:heme exporter protein CcmD